MRHPIIITRNGEVVDITPQIRLDICMRKLLEDTAPIYKEWVCIPASEALSGIIELYEQETHS